MNQDKGGRQRSRGAAQGETGGQRIRTATWRGLLRDLCADRLSYCFEDLSCRLHAEGDDGQSGRRDHCISLR